MFRVALLVESPDLFAAGRGCPGRGVPPGVHAGDSGQAELPNRQPAGVIVAQPMGMGQLRTSLELGPFRPVVHQYRDIQCGFHPRARS